MNGISGLTYSQLISYVVCRPSTRRTVGCLLFSWHTVMAHSEGEEDVMEVTGVPLHV